MSLTKELLALALAVGLAVSAGHGSTQAASPLVQGHHSRVRLVAGGRDGDGGRLAGIAIALDAGFKTYWRTPGESGLPPGFDWSRSSNLKRADVLWPAPSRFEDAGGVAYGYKEGVVLPLRIAPEDATRPVELRLALTYGVCNDICIPARAELSLTLDGDEPGEPAITDALARVPEPRSLGDAGDLAVLGVKPAGAKAVAVSVRAPEGQSPRLFVEAPEGWFIMARERPDPPPDGAPQGATAVFLAEIFEEPPAAAGPVAIRLTLTAGSGAVETTAKLDTVAPSR